MTTETEIAVQQEEKAQAQKAQEEDVPNNSSLDAPFTKPFEGFSYIKKDWTDDEDGIESVVLNVSLGQINLPANWNNVESFVMMPEWGSLPLKRSWVVRLPTHFNGDQKYLFHYFFQIKYTDGSERVSDTFTQLMMPKNVEYIDHSGSCTHILLHWSVDDWSYPQNTELEVEGIEWGDDFSVSQVPYRSGDRLYESGRSILIQRIPPPRRFFATIWVPSGTKLNYCFNLISTELDGTLRSLWDNNHGKNFEMTI